MHLRSAMLLDHLCRVEDNSVPENDTDTPIHPFRVQSVHLVVLRAIQVLQSAKPLTIEPQCSVDSSLPTGLVAGWCLHGIAMDYRDGDIASFRETGEKRNSPGFHRGCPTEPWEAFGSKCGMATWLQSHRRHRDKDLRPLRVSAMSSFTNTGFVQVRMVVGLRVSSLGWVTSTGY